MEKNRADEAKEKERVAYAQIDWHSFVVVETVDYQVQWGVMGCHGVPWGVMGCLWGGVGCFIVVL